MHTEPHLHVAYLHANGTLAGAESEPATIPLTWSYQDWLMGTAPPTWTGQPGNHPMLVSKVHLTITYQALAPVVSTTLRPDFTAWFGTVDAGGRMAIVDHLFAPGPAVLQAGETHTIAYEVDLPLGGLLRATDEALMLQVATYYPDVAPGTLAIVLDQSRVEWWAHPVAEPKVTEQTTLAFGGSLLGGRCVADASPNGAAMASHAFDVPAGAAVVHVGLDRVAGQGAGPDLDMYLTSADGTRVAYAGGSAAPEAIRLGAANIAAAGTGPWTLHVYNCQPQSSVYDVVVTIGATATPAAAP